MRSRPSKIWQYQNPDIDISLMLAAELGISPLIAGLLVNRDIKTVEEARIFLYPKYSDLHSPFKFADMDKAVERIQLALKKGEQICIYGDYDADGTTATALLVNAFRYLDYEATYYIPHRFDEGYGLNEGAVKDVRNNGCSLMITVDCGISSINEVKLANELGMDVILTDHHQPPIDNAPPAYAIISPKVSGNEYPYTDLAGVGLAFKVAQGLIDDESFLTSLLDLVALGTVVDLAPITGENRTLSRLGLAEINKRERIGIQELCKVASLTDKPLLGRSLSFGLGPRLNAAGRMDTAKNVVELLTTESRDTAAQIADKLNKCNQERKDIENKIQEKANELLNKDENLAEMKGLVVASEEWDERAKGVVGIVASRLLEQYYRPVFVLAIDGDKATGSGRCIKGMNLADSLNSCSNLLIKHGGHEAAAGVTLKKNNLPKFKKAFNEFACEHLTEEDLIPKLSLDFETNLSSLTLQSIEQFEILEPFGLKNPSPRFVCKDLSINGPPRIIGKENDHILFYINDGLSTVSKKAIGWRQAQHASTLSRPNISLKIAFSPEINEYNNERSVQLILEEFHVETQDRAPNLVIFPPTDVPSSGRVVDSRNKNKKDYLFELINNRASCIIYVLNEEKMDQLLTNVLPEKAPMIGRHDASTTDEKEIQLLEQIKKGELVGIVSSDTFSDTTLKNIPIIEHFVFCHLSMQPIEFFNRCLPAADVDNTTFIHLLYNSETDVKLLYDAVENSYPNRNFLAELYRKLQEIVSNDYMDPNKLIETLGIDNKLAVENGLTIFEELDLLERKVEAEYSLVKLLSKQKKSLDRSATYLKCEWLRQTSQTFEKFQLKESNKKIWERITDECGIVN